MMDGCESLHHQKDGCNHCNPTDNGMFTNQRFGINWYQGFGFRNQVTIINHP